MADRLIRVDMSRESVELEEFPADWKMLGGRALSARILLDECDPLCDALGPDNVLVFAPGTLAGTAAPTSGRISVGAKSPLTGGIKEANSGGNPGQHLTKLGYRAIVVKGQPADPERRYGLEVDAEGARLVAADAHKGLWNYANCERLAERYPKTASFVSCGPAGELLLSGASVAFTDQDNRYPARHAARGGLGAVMGSKGLKFIAVCPGRARARLPARRREFQSQCKSLTRRYLDGPRSLSTGTATAVGGANALYTFPYKNRVEGQSPDAETLDGHRILESFEERGGGMHNCLTGCIVQCSNVVHDAEGQYRTSALEFETLTLLGSNIAMKSWEDVAELDRLCDEIGLDTIETGAAIGVLMDAGGLEWGDLKAVKALFHEIPGGTERGRAIGSGAAATGRYTGHPRVPVVKGQALPAWDPRPLKATGVTYATSPMGGDHTAGLIVNPGMPEQEFARASQLVQIVNAVCDSSGFCQFVGPSLDDIRALYSSFFGEEVSRKSIADHGWEVLSNEWEFNRRAGFTEADDVLPQCMKEDAVGPKKLVFDVDPAIIADAKVRKSFGDELFTKKAIG
ncbi:MAG: aldehyde ferredoxin oxidoreductase N-terminal domain-containing protein [Myxococcota bacterium]